MANNVNREVFRIEGLEGVIKTLNALPAELVSKASGPIQKAMRAGAKLILASMQQNVQDIINHPNEPQGLPSDSTGTLLKSLRVARMRARSGQRGEAMSIGPKRGAKYARQFGKPRRPLTAAYVGTFLERGTERQQPKAWALPAFDENRQRVLDTFVSELNKNLDRIVKKLARQNKAKL